MKKLLAMLLSVVLVVSLCVGCGVPAPASSKPASTPAATPSSTPAANGDKEVLEFYHGYFHEESAWAPAKAMRDIYDEFAKQHADGSVEFKAIPVENKEDVMNNKVSGASFPDLIDLAGSSLSLSAISQNLVYDLKPYIDQENLKDAVGINYTQNDVDGKIYTVHDQLLTIGYWYNQKLLQDAGATMPDTWKTWDDFSKATKALRDKGIAPYSAGQGSYRAINAMLGLTEAGRKVMSGPLTEEAINSKEFEEAFKTVAKIDQENGAYAVPDFTASMGDFNAKKTALHFNGVWAAGGFKDDADFQPAIFPGGVSLSSAGGGLCVAAGMSEAKTQLALEFIKYMTSAEVQSKIFTLVGANPCNSTLDLNAIAKESGDSAAILLAKACSMANEATYVVGETQNVWGADVNTILMNKLSEVTVSSADVNAKFDELKKEILAVIS